MNYAGRHHIGAVSFLIVDFFLFFSVSTLTVVQASQVCVPRILTAVPYQKKNKKNRSSCNDFNPLFIQN